MQRINNTYAWLRWMHKKIRFSPHPTILAVRGAELVRGRPSEVTKPPPPPVPKSIEEQEHSAQAETPSTGL
jgi:hypothetical protein